MAEPRALRRGKIEIWSAIVKVESENSQRDDIIDLEKKKGEYR